MTGMSYNIWYYFVCVVVSRTLFGSSAIWTHEYHISLVVRQYSSDTCVLSLVRDHRGSMVWCHRATYHVSPQETSRAEGGSPAMPMPVVNVGGKDVTIPSVIIVGGQVRVYKYVCIYSSFRST